MKAATTAQIRALGLSVAIAAPTVILPSRDALFVYRAEQSPPPSERGARSVLLVRFGDLHVEVEDLDSGYRVSGRL